MSTTLFKSMKRSKRHPAIGQRVSNPARVAFRRHASRRNDRVWKEEYLQAAQEVSDGPSGLGSQDELSEEDPYATSVLGADDALDIP